MEQNILEQILEGSIKPTNLPLETLRKITDGFSTDRIIGEGGFGTVYKGDVRNGNVAVKRIKSGMTINDKLFRREVNNLMEVNHPNVVRFLGLCSNTVETPMKDPESRGYIYAEIRERLLCFEYVSNGSLDTRITDELRGLEWDTRYSIIKGICAGLHYLHMEKHILHMDLKPANILLDNQMVPKITDFGLSRPVENSQTMTTNHFASPGYSAPENLFGGGKMSIQSDMYSLGVIIIELVTGRRGTPDSNNTLRRWRHRWNKSGKEIPLEYHQQVTECIEIGSLCQTENPYSRPFISDIMSKFAEMDLNNHSRNANESTVGQINLLTWEDDMLGVEPLELQFEYNKQEEILSCLVELSNDTDGFILFVIQKMRPLPYSIQQNKGILKPRSKCCVHITMPAAHKAALQYSTSNKRYTKEFVVQSIKVNEGLATKDFNQDMFDKYTEGQHVDEIHLGAVFEEPCSEEIIDLPSKQAKKQHATSGIGPTLIKPGSVQLVIKSNKKAPLLEYKQKVMLELTGGDYTSDRPGLDLVAVLDVSGSMRGHKMDQLKMAMRFVIRKLSPVDRLSIVEFSRTARLLCPLRQVTEASQRELQQLIDGLQAVGPTNIESALKMGIHALAIRKVSDGRVAAMMLMCDGQESSGSADQVNCGDVPVYTFGFGWDSDPMLLNLVAANSMGGTFSHIQDEDIMGGGLTMAFSQCLAGLLTVAVQNLEVTVAAVGGESTIVKVTAGSYTQTHDAGSVTIRFGNLYSREVRKVIIDLLLPAVQSEHSTDILNVTYSHGSSSAGLQFVEPPKTLTVWRTGVEVSEEEKQLPAELRAEELRLHTVKIIKEAKTMADSNMLLDAQDKLVEAQNMLMEEQSNPVLMAELQELLELLKTKKIYDKQGRHFVLSSESSHCRQRFAARGNMEKMVRLFATARMDMYLNQAKEFYGDPKMLLPSLDEDVKEEVGALTINVAAREEEMRRMSLDAED